MLRSDAAHFFEDKQFRVQELNKFSICLEVAGVEEGRKLIVRDLFVQFNNLPPTDIGADIWPRVIM
jgi:hypothetical protein